MTFLPSPGKSFILGQVDEAVSHELGLGELAGLTVANEADGTSYDVRRTLKTQTGDSITSDFSPSFFSSSSDQHQHGRPEEDLESQVYSAQPLWLSEESGLSSSGAHPDHRLRGPHPQTVEPPEDGASQEVGPRRVDNSSGVERVYDTMTSHLCLLILQMCCVRCGARLHVQSTQVRRRPENSGFISQFRFVTS